MSGEQAGGDGLEQAAILLDPVLGSVAQESELLRVRLVQLDGVGLVSGLKAEVAVTGKSICDELVGPKLLSGWVGGGRVLLGLSAAVEDLSDEVAVAVRAAHLSHRRAT